MHLYINKIQFTLEQTRELLKKVENKVTSIRIYITDEQDVQDVKKLHKYISTFNLQEFYLISYFPIIILLDYLDNMPNLTRLKLRNCMFGQINLPNIERMTRISVK